MTKRDYCTAPCRIKKGVKASEEYAKGKHVNFSGYTGLCDPEDFENDNAFSPVMVYFDEESLKKIPRVYALQGEKEGFATDSYTFRKCDVELINKL